MKRIKFIAVLCGVLLLSVAANAQRAEVAVTLNEQFFDALLDAVFQNSGAPEFPLTSENRTKRKLASRGIVSAFASPILPCSEFIRLLREGGGTRTAVRFREGKIYVPMAFDGNYSPPLIGCVNFAGVAESAIDLEFDRSGQRLIARANVSNVSLNGSGGLGGAVIAKMVQGAIDRKVNPIEIVRLDRLSFDLPLRNGPGTRMKAVDLKHEVTGGSLVIHIIYEFVKS